MNTFELTEQHIKLLRRFYVNWQDTETGAPEIDPKRPYGNSAVASDIAEILVVKGQDDGELADDQVHDLMALHYETHIALQIVLVTGQFKAGKYVKADEHDALSWRPA
jgi:hypothetical protein